MRKFDGKKKTPMEHQRHQLRPRVGFWQGKMQMRVVKTIIGVRGASEMYLHQFIFFAKN